MIELALILACAPNVHPTTIRAIVKVESNGNPLALNVNKKQGVGYPLPKEIKSRKKAVEVAKRAIKDGRTVDMGYMQINSVNLPRLGYTVEDMFDPCKNLAAGAKILTQAYAAALPRHKDEQSALRAALSTYNTGNQTGGFRNGYVQKYNVPVVRVASSNKDRYKAKTAVDFSKRRSAWGKVAKE